MSKLRFGLILLGLLSISGICFAQNDYQQWLKEQNKEYNHFLSQQDSEFVGFLKKNWVKVTVDTGMSPFSQPKPRKPVVFTPTQKKAKAFEMPVKKIPTIKIKPELHPENKKKEPPVNHTNQQNMTGQNSGSFSGNNAPSGPSTVKSVFTHTISFYESKWSVIYNPALNVPYSGSASNQSIADYWQELSKSDYSISLKRALNLRSTRKLNGWGYAKLLFDIGEKITEGNRNESYLFTWFMLVKSGYQARVGYEANQIYLLLATNNKMYSTPYFYFHNSANKYYVILLSHNESEPAGPMYTYKASYPGALQKVSLGVTTLPDLGNLVGKKVIHFSYEGKAYALPVDYNKNLIDFFHYYPHTALTVYFDAGLSKVARNTLLPELNKLIVHKSQKQAANFLLHFVQYATKYETDQQQFGWEKPFFPEESLYYPYSDCEDRAVLFSYLVRNLMGLNVIGLHYPDHVTTAVHFTVPVDGDFIQYKDQKYLICDPTYIGASIGESMPRFRNVPAKIIGN